MILGLGFVRWVTTQHPAVDLRPKVQPGMSVVVECPRLCAHDIGDSGDKIIVECSTHEYGLRERSRIAEISRRLKGHTGRFSDSMKSLTPPDIGRQANPWNPRTYMPGVVELLLEGEKADQCFGSCNGI